jgi:predicted RNase H-like HicB family nuclease
MEKNTRKGIGVDIFMKKNYTFIINKGIDGYYLASVPELTGVMTQAKNIEEIFSRVKEAIEEEKRNLLLMI